MLIFQYFLAIYSIFDPFSAFLSISKHCLAYLSKFRLSGSLGVESMSIHVFLPTNHLVRGKMAIIKVDKKVFDKVDIHHILRINKLT